MWIGAKNGVVSVFDSRMRYLGDLTSQGSIVPHSQQPIGHAYAFAEDAHGVIWMGTKFKGLYSLTPTAAGTFSVRHYEADGSRYALPHNDIFCLTTDHHGRLWIATYGGGLCYTLLGDPRHRFIHAGNLAAAVSNRPFCQGALRYGRWQRHDMGGHDIGYAVVQRTL